MSEIPEDIKETAAGLIANYGFDAALLEGAICAALLAERRRWQTDEEQEPYGLMPVFRASKA